VLPHRALEFVVHAHRGIRLDDRIAECLAADFVAPGEEFVLHQFFEFVFHDGSL